jgi:hypothetical protein
MKPKLLHWLAIFLILETGLLHILTAQAEYEEAAYMGYLFAANFFGALLAAFAIYHRQLWGWVLGLVVAAGSIAGFIYSRTFGMPGMNIEEWFSPYGIVALLVEGGFIFIFLLCPWRQQVDGALASGFNWSKYGVPAVGIFSVILIGASTFAWNTLVSEHYGHHVGSLSHVCSTPLTSFEDLEKNYGVQVSRVATTMIGGIVDVRLKVVDPDKAHDLLQNQAALLVNQQSLILAPHIHSHDGTRLKTGKIFVIFFPTQGIITPGTQVSLVFGPVRVAPAVVQ